LTDARRAAWQLLRAVGAGQLFEAARDQALSGLDARDRRLAQEIAAGVLRRRRTLDRELKDVLGKRWRTTEPELRELLRIGAYQLRHLTRVPKYAAVQSTVEAAKPLGPKRAAFVNAVLRRVVQRARGVRRMGGSADRRTEPTERRTAEPPTRLSALAERYSHPEWLVRRWLAGYGEASTEALLAHHNARPPLVIQPARWPREQLERALTAAQVEWREAPGGYGLMVRRSRPRELPGFEEGGFIVQGPGQARLLAHAAIPAGALVWDCCAAPGGKAVTLSARGPVLASDWGRARLKRLVETVHRAGPRLGGSAARSVEPSGRRAAASPGVFVFAADARAAPLRADSMDAVWLDAPCTATGTMSRHPDARWRMSPRRLEVACRRQAVLLGAVASTVRAGGLLVYTTCSLEPEENQAQVEAFLSRHRAFARARDDLAVWPPDTGSDGGYIAVLRRD